MIGAKDKHAGMVASCPNCRNHVEIPGQVVNVETIDNLDAENPLLNQTARKPHGSTMEHVPFGATLESQSGLTQNTVPGASHLTEPTSKKREAKIGKSVLALFVASVVALFCGVAWVVLWGVTGIQIGLLAWGIGGLIGLVAGALAKNPSPIFCGLAGVVCALTFVGVKAAMAGIVMLAALSVDMVRDMAVFNPETYKYSQALKDKMLDEGEFTTAQQTIVSNQLASFFGDGSSGMFEEFDDDESYEIAAEVDKIVRKRLDDMTDHDRNSLLRRVRAKYPEWIEFQYHYEATMHSMLDEDEFPDGAVAAFAKHHLLRLDDHYSEDYYNNMTPNDRTKLNEQLRKLVVSKYAKSSPEQRFEWVRNCIRAHETWIPVDEEFTGVMEMMHSEKQFEGELADLVEAKIDSEIRYKETTYYDDIDFEELNQRENKLAKLVNAKLVEMPQEQLTAIVDDLRLREPKWNVGPFADLAGEAKIVEDALQELGTDGTFLGSLASVLHFYDFIWLLLGVSSAYTVANKYGFKKV